MVFYCLSGIRDKLFVERLMVFSHPLNTCKHFLILSRTKDPAPIRDYTVTN